MLYYKVHLCVLLALSGRPRPILGNTNLTPGSSYESMCSSMPIFSGAACVHHISQSTGELILRVADVRNVEAAGELVCNMHKAIAWSTHSADSPRLASISRPELYEDEYDLNLETRSNHS